MTHAARDERDRERDRDPEADPRDVTYYTRDQLGPSPEDVRWTPITDPTEVAMIRGALVHGSDPPYEVWIDPASVFDGWEEVAAGTDPVRISPYPQEPHVEITDAPEVAYYMRGESELGWREVTDPATIAEIVAVWRLTSDPVTLATEVEARLAYDPVHDPPRPSAADGAPKHYAIHATGPDRGDEHFVEFADPRVLSSYETYLLTQDQPTLAPGAAPDLAPSAAPERDLTPALDL